MGARHGRAGDVPGEIASIDSCAQLHDFVLAVGAVMAPVLDEQAAAARSCQQTPPTPGDDTHDEITFADVDPDTVPAACHR